MFRAKGFRFRVSGFGFRVSSLLPLSNTMSEAPMNALGGGAVCLSWTCRAKMKLFSGFEIRV